jgi:hypothetical protein
MVLHPISLINRVTSIRDKFYGTEGVSMQNAGLPSLSRGFLKKLHTEILYYAYYYQKVAPTTVAVW